MPNEKNKRPNATERHRTKNLKKKSSQQTKESIVLGLAAGLSQAEICRQYGLSKAYVSEVANDPENALRINKQLEQCRQESFEDLKAFVRHQNQSFVEIATRISRMMVKELALLEGNREDKETKRNLELLANLWKMIQSRFCDHQISLKDAVDQAQTLNADDKEILDAWVAENGQ